MVDDVSFTVVAGRARHAARALRLRQDDHAADGRGPRAGDERAHRDRRHRRHAARGERARRQHGVPVVRAVSAHDGAAERLLRAAVDVLRQGEGARARAREARDAGPRRARRAACRRSSPAASSSASRWRARWCSSRPCCCSTSRCRTSTRSCAAACGRRSATCSNRSSLTVIYVTHDQEEALAVSDHIIVMDSGRIAQQGTPHELYETPASRFLADFIGDANLVDGELSGGRGRPDVHRGRRRDARARGRHRAGSRHARGAAEPVAPRRAGAGQRAGRVQARRLPRQPDRVHGGDALGRAAGVRRKGAASRARATSRSAWCSTGTRRSCCAR